MRKLKKDDNLLTLADTTVFIKCYRTGYCDMNCAWFHIEIDRKHDAKCDTKGNPVYAEFAYCKDHCIGEVIE